MIGRSLIFCAMFIAASTGCTTTGGYAGRAQPQKAADINAQLGLRYMEQGNYKVALEKLERALEFNSRHAQAHHYLGVLYERLGQYDDADEHYRDALSYSDESAIRNNYGVFLCSRGKYDAAEKQFLAVLKDPMYPAREGVYENLGMCLAKKPDLEKADTYLRKGLSINAKMHKSLLAMAQVKFAQGEYLRARAYLQRYLAEKNVSHTAQSLWLGIQIERRLGDQNAVASYGVLLRNKFADSEEAKLYRESLAK